MRRAGIDPKDVEEVIPGNVLQAGVGQNPARQALRGAGIPDAVGAFTVNKVCGSGLKSVALAAQAIRAGDAEVIVAGGMESMSNAPYLLPSARTGARLGHAELVDSMVHDGLWDIYNDFHMGRPARRLPINMASPGKTRTASPPIPTKGGGGDGARRVRPRDRPCHDPTEKGEALVVKRDEGPRADSTAEALGKLRPAFRKENGTVTAGNASTINDGAAALVVMSDVRARKLGLKPLARITGYATGGLAPSG